MAIEMLPEQPNCQMFKLARESRGLSLKAVARRLRLTDRDINDIERGERTVSVDELSWFSDLYEYPAAFFFRRDDIESRWSICRRLDKFRVAGDEEVKG